MGIGLRHRDRMFGYEGRIWCAYFWFVGFDCFSLGAHVCLGAPNIEIHLPLGFVRIGRLNHAPASNWQGWTFFRPYPRLAP